MLIDFFMFPRFFLLISILFTKNPSSSLRVSMFSCSRKFIWDSMFALLFCRFILVFNKYFPEVSNFVFSLFKFISRSMLFFGFRFMVCSLLKKADSKFRERSFISKLRLFFMVIVIFSDLGLISSGDIAIIDSIPIIFIDNDSSCISFSESLIL